MALKKVVCANVCLSLAGVLGLLGAIALFVLSIIDVLDVNISNPTTTFPAGKSFCDETIVGASRPFSVRYTVPNDTEMYYKICSQILPDHNVGEGFNGTFCLYPVIPRDDSGHAIHSQMKVYCGFATVALFERFGIGLGYIIGSIFVLLWMVLTRQKVEGKGRWVGKFFGGLYTLWSLLSLVAAFYLMIMDAKRVSDSRNWCETVYKHSYCDPPETEVQGQQCDCGDYNLYIGVPLTEAIMIVVFTFAFGSSIFRWYADYKSTREGYANLDAAVDDLVKR